MRLVSAAQGTHGNVRRALFACEDEYVAGNHPAVPLVELLGLARTIARAHRSVDIGEPASRGDPVGLMPLAWWHSTLRCVEQVAKRLRNPKDLYAMHRVLSMFSHAGPLTALTEILERFGLGSPRSPVTRAMLVGVTVSSGVWASQALDHLLETHVMWELERIADRMDLQPLFLAPPEGKVR